MRKGSGAGAAVGLGGGCLLAGGGKEMTTPREPLQRPPRTSRFFNNITCAPTEFEGGGAEEKKQGPAMRKPVLLSISMGSGF